MRNIIITIALLTAACTGCPVGDDMSKNYTLERDAVVHAMQQLGYETDIGMVYSTPIVYRDLEGTQADCDGNPNGCFCEDMTCPGAIVLREKDLFKPGKNCSETSSKKGGCWDTAQETALHEYVHAALKYMPSHLNTEDHPPIFWEVWQLATKLNNN